MVHEHSRLEYLHMEEGREYKREQSAASSTDEADENTKVGYDQHHQTSGNYHHQPHEVLSQAPILLLQVELLL